MTRRLAASSRNLSVASSSTSLRSRLGWASKSNSSRRQGAGKLAKRSRPAWRRASVASTSMARRRSRKAVWLSLAWLARSSAAGRASAAAWSFR